jgi:hypothetical protein
LHRLGWHHGTERRAGLATTYEWFCAHSPETAVMSAREARLPRAGSTGSGAVGTP